ncbi:MAG: ABC transporter permease [Paludibacteraceae bacterium]|nr:ABC transporter permease [Paludibacteraceae bacterium]
MCFNDITKSFFNILEVWRNEIRRIFKDHGMITFFIVLPLAYPIIYSWIYNNERVSEVPTTVVDLSHSSISREFARKIEATPDVHIIAHAGSLKEAQQSVPEGVSEGVILIPSDFSESVNRMQSSHVSVYCNMNGMLYYKAIISAVNDVALDMGKELQIKALGNTTSKQDEISTAPIECEYVPMFNPTNGYACYILPAVLILIIQQSLLLGIGITAGTDKEKNRMLGIDKKIPEMLIGRALAFFMLYVFVNIWLLVIMPSLFNLTQISQPSALLGLAIPYTLACIFFATAASALVRERETVMLIFVFTSLPMLFISGVSWPQSNIPDLWRYISYAIPSTFGINGFQKVNTMGALLEDISFEYKALWIQTIVYFILSCVALAIRKNRLKAENNKQQ